MKKFISIIAMVLAVSVASALDINDKVSFQATGVGAGIAIPAGVGKIVNTQMSVYFGTNKTVAIHCPSVVGQTSTTGSAVTNVSLYTGSSNVIAGYTLTTSDYLVVDSSTASGIQLAQVKSIEVYASGITAYTTTGALTLTAKDKVFISKSTDILNYVGLATNSVTTIRDAFTGKLNAPVYIKVGASGSPDTSVTGTCTVEK